MQMSSLRLPLASVLFAVAAAPAIAGNYAEGDPRPVARTSSVSSAAVSADARAWMATAPTVGYPDGNPEASVQVREKTRAEVRADTMNWVKSGLASVGYSDAYANANHPAYLKAKSAYAQLRGSSEDSKTSLAPTNGSAVAR